MKESDCESPHMNTYGMEVRKLEDKFQGIELHHVPPKGNNDVDVLAKMAAQRDPIRNGVFINDLHAPSIRIKPDPPSGPSTSVPGGPGQVLGGPDCFATGASAV
jgi:hypothetical protein